MTVTSKSGYFYHLPSSLQNEILKQLSKNDLKRLEAVSKQFYKNILWDSLVQNYITKITMPMANKCGWWKRAVVLMRTSDQAQSGLSVCKNAGIVLDMKKLETDQAMLRALKGLGRNFEEHPEGLCACELD